MDDSAAVRGAICNFIGRATHFKVCCEAGQGAAAIEKARKRIPALVILDLSNPMKGVETASDLRHMVPGTMIIGLAMFDVEFHGKQIAGAGFDVIVSRHEGLANLGEVINALLPDPPELPTA